MHFNADDRFALRNEAGTPVSPGEKYASLVSFAEGRWFCRSAVNTINTSATMAADLFRSLPQPALSECLGPIVQADIPEDFIVRTERGRGHVPRLGEFILDKPTRLTFNTRLLRRATITFALRLP